MMRKRKKKLRHTNVQDKVKVAIQYIEQRYEYNLNKTIPVSKYEMMKKRKGKKNKKKESKTLKCIG